ncbi:molybdopterin-containing oxidoreductase family protein [Novosphingobium cyanobacteriorum]|uniref:Molybdopterin-dependent oxidoreductase n=1 Tax=Novosphingobium cyanobacteriorum TaxID=3024215 RepID=A0ABT6CET9_9SPHN|nr:molybdopterin-dependent oxidoreductase [Novosphingobium cyanobacteriorum]MDF8331988.1 molybdopterin-dependent oxidoreductase [Novosphingobium cyanobacteriorum]
MGETRTAHSFCRICSGSCGVVLDVADDRIVGIRGDKAHPLTRGYACIKGLQAADMLHGPDRLSQPLRRGPDGRHVPILLDEALDEIAERLGTIIDRFGPRAVAGWRGTNPWFQTLSHYALPGWLASLGSDQFYSSMTIDQSAKWVAMERIGVWAAGRQFVTESDVWMLVGNNPLVSVSAGALSFNPQKTLRDLKARGLKLIVIDPRRTQTAEMADLHLAVRPGEDVTLAAGLLHAVLAEGLEDREFCDTFVAGLDALRAAVAPFTPAAVAERADVPQEDILAAARLFAAGPKGCVQTGTGPDMGPRSNLAEHLYECLNVICGRFPRAGDRVGNPGVMSRPFPRRAQVAPPRRRWQQGRPSRVRGIGPLQGEMMAGTLAEEIMAPDEDRVRALFVVGGNPASSMPDQQRMVEALRELDLLVLIDPAWNETARLADFVLPGRLLYEVPAVPLLNVEPYFFPIPFAQYTPAVVPAPPETRDDWRYLWELSRRIGRPYSFNGIALDMEAPPTSEALLARLLEGAQVPLEEIARHPSGGVFEVPEQFVEPSTRETRFEVMPADVAAELGTVAQEGWARTSAVDAAWPFRLIVHRVRETYNGQYRDLPAIRKRLQTNRAWCHPDDLAAAGFAPDDLVDIVSAFGRIPAVLGEDASVRRGAIAMTHGFGGLPDDPQDAQARGANPNRLIDAARDCEPINAMPRMSAIPIRIEPKGQAR